MGQFLSRQATPTRKQHGQHQDISQNRPRRHKRSSETHVGNGRPDARENLKSHRTSSRIRSTNHTPDIKTSLHPLREIDGNVGIPRRQPKYIRGQASKASTKVKDRPRKSDTTQPPSRTKDPKTSRTRLHHSKPAPLHPHPKQIQDCIICTDTRSLHRFPSRPPTQSCTHAPNVCSRCLRTWIETSSSTKIWNEIDCPVCATRMQYDDMRAFAPRVVFRRYATLTTTALHDAIPNHRWCLAKGCKAGQVHPPGAPRFRCKTCKKSHCVEHGVAWHKGETCAEYDYRTNKGLKKQEEEASRKMIRESTKKCPGCKRSIEKSWGCDHMTCSKCKKEFCWQCLASYKKKGVRAVMHREGCQYYDPDWDPDSAN